MFIKVESKEQEDGNIAYSCDMDGTLGEALFGIEVSILHLIENAENNVDNVVPLEEKVNLISSLCNKAIEKVIINDRKVEVKSEEK